MLFTAWLAFHEFGRGLEKVAASELKQNAKTYGMQIMTRLQLASVKAAEIVEIAERKGVAAVADHKYLLSDFEAIWVTQGDDPPTALLGTADTDIERSDLDRPFLRTGGTQLLLTPDYDLVLLQTTSRLGPNYKTYAFRLVAEQIWGQREILSYSTEYCVFSQTGVMLHCTRDVDAGIHQVLISDTDTRATAFAEMTNDDGRYVAALWQLFLKGAFHAPAIDVIAIQERWFALKSGADFRRIFLPAVALVLVLVGVFSLNLIARSLVPLQQLTRAAREFSGGHLESRVRVKTGDEFEWLAEAFNNMAIRLGRQISTLKAMSGIDHKILSGTDLEAVCEDVIGHLVELTKCSVAAVISRDVDAPTKAKMVSMFEGEFCHERIELPGYFGKVWNEPMQVCLSDPSSAALPYRARFKGNSANYVISIPVVLNEDLKGVLLLGFGVRYDLSRDGAQQCADLASRYAVALASVEREDALYRQAHYDELTGLPNRQLLKDRLDQHINSVRADQRKGAMLFLDLDRFKEINDVFGHSVGDSVLIQASERIVAEVRERDTVARLGGDEFVIVLPDVHSENIVGSTAEKLLVKLGEAFSVNAIDHYLSASIGIVIFPDDGESVETLLRNADAAMYRAKDAGRGRFEYFSERLNDESRRKIGLERDLRNAYHNSALDVAYQPQFDIASGNISGAEALLRWNHPVHGPVSPEEFIPLAEESELIVKIGSWVLEQACRDLHLILDKGHHPGPMSINVSARQLREGSFESDVMRPIRRYGIHPGYIQLEVTETTVAQNRDTAIQILERLRKEGVRVAIDDFGTGYSSLSYLQQMPFDVIKIDKSFIDQIGANKASDDICRTIIRIADELGKKCIAEGVECREQLDFLQENGCGYVQGYYYSNPLRRKEFATFVEKQNFHTQRRKALEIL